MGPPVKIEGGDSPVSNGPPPDVDLGGMDNRLMNRTSLQNAHETLLHGGIHLQRACQFGFDRSDAMGPFRVVPRNRHPESLRGQSVPLEKPDRKIRDTGAERSHEHFGGGHSMILSPILHGLIGIQTMLPGLHDQPETLLPVYGQGFFIIRHFAILEGRVPLHQIPLPFQDGPSHVKYHVRIERVKGQKRQSVPTDIGPCLLLGPVHQPGNPDSGHHQRGDGGGLVDDRNVGQQRAFEVQQIVQRQDRQ